MDRREFLRLSAGAAAALAGAGACGGGSEPGRAAGSTTTAKRKGRRATLRIAQVNHFVPAHDTWFSGEYTRRWGEEHDVEVVVDFIPYGQLVDRAQTEVASQRGHDIFNFVGPPVFEDEVIDHRDIIAEVEAKVGPMAPLMKRSTLNPRTARYFAFPDYWAAKVVHYRSDLWDGVEAGLVPDTWEDVLRAGPQLKGKGHPVGFGLSTDLDSTHGMLALIDAYGASVQDEEGRVVVDSPAMVEAVEVAATMSKTAMTDEVFGWDASANNRELAAGRSSMILNAISALRAIEGQDATLGRKVALAPLPAGPVARLGSPSFLATYVIWRFTTQVELAQQFLVDHALSSQDALLNSGFYNLPAFPGAVTDLPGLLAADRVSDPKGKYSVLADATEWTTNFGHPGHDNPAMNEVINEFLIPRMFSAVARGEQSAADAVKSAAAQAEVIFDKWRERGKV
jgi:multiple sugar transport system substrate-binding protein